MLNTKLLRIVVLGSVTLLLSGLFVTQKDSPHGLKASQQGMENTGFQMQQGGPLLTTPLSHTSMSHYSVWEAEENTSSGVGIKHDNGRVSADGTSWESVDGDTVGCLVRGPGYRAEIRRAPFYPCILYTASFRMKVSDISVPEVVATLEIATGEFVVASKDIRASDFPARNTYTDIQVECFCYDDFSGDYEQLLAEDVEFRVTWWGKGKLTVDWIKVCDQEGEKLIDHGLFDAVIVHYASHYWGKAEMIEWYGLRYRPMPTDCLYPYAYVDRVIREAYPGLEVFTIAQGEDSGSVWCELAQ